eukprot:TRINITY_DN5701_c0_g2_i1.p2 TRINITY_DN5701_c0_g2~~TRINITY_DN5701_c0_g2_i1.p2  ORF type:complete len:339 (-),score=50.81 TRINITY_DN5701_c0_g2_i1:78-1094(-)
MESAVIHSAARFSRAIIMPNLIPPITTVEMALEYKKRILGALKKSIIQLQAVDEYNIDKESLLKFEPLMTLYMTDSTTPEEIEKARNAGIIAVKLYPAGATTNSESGVTDIQKIYPTLQYMADINMPLLIHGETTDSDVDVFDREKEFLQRTLGPLLEKIPQLKVVLEHVSTKDAVDFVVSAGERVGATVTPQHMLLNRNAIFNKGLNPHHYCLPILKREQHRLAVLQAATSGSPKFFLGTDSAPHTVERKECACGCAGIFNAPVALQIYLELFEQMDALHNFEKFTSLNGPEFYGLQKNKEIVSFVKNSWKVKELYGFGDSAVVPLCGGSELSWQIC